MIVYHGTTARRAQRICTEGFLPRKPSRRVWFAESKAYADRRGKQQARRTRDRPVVLRCELDLPRLQSTIGDKSVFHQGGIIAIDGPVGASVLSRESLIGVPVAPREMAAWLNRILRIKPWKGVGASHPGVQRLSRWVERRIESKDNHTIKPNELLELAYQWLPDYFAEVRVDPKRLTAWPQVKTIRVVAESSARWVAADEDEALNFLESEQPAMRIRGLKKLKKIGDPDLFDWCAMFLDDAQQQVRLTAMKIMRDCEAGDAAMLRPLTRSEDMHLRGAALSLLAQHDADHRLHWIERGLKDPATHVRLQVARHLRHIDAKQHRRLFEFALTDPNPQINKMARKLTAHRGYAKIRW